jgi:hypothetical protein
MQIGKIDEIDDDGDLFPGESNTEDVLEGGVRYWPDVCGTWFSKDFVPRDDNEPFFAVPREWPDFPPRKSDHFLGLGLPSSLCFQPGVSHCALICCIVKILEFY